MSIFRSNISRYYSTINPQLKLTKNNVFIILFFQLINQINSCLFIIQINIIRITGDHSTVCGIQLPAPMRQLTTGWSGSYGISRLIPISNEINRKQSSTTDKQESIHGDQDLGLLGTHRPYTPFSWVFLNRPFYLSLSTLRCPTLFIILAMQYMLLHTTSSLSQNYHIEIYTCVHA